MIQETERKYLYRS